MVNRCEEIRSKSRKEQGYEAQPGNDGRNTTKESQTNIAAEPGGIVDGQGRLPPA